MLAEHLLQGEGVRTELHQDLGQGIVELGEARLKGQRGRPGADDAGLDQREGAAMASHHAVAGNVQAGVNAKNRHNVQQLNRTYVLS